MGLPGFFLPFPLILSSSSFLGLCVPLSASLSVLLPLSPSSLLPSRLLSPPSQPPGLRRAASRPSCCSSHAALFGFHWRRRLLASSTPALAPRRPRCLCLLAQPLSRPPAYAWTFQPRSAALFTQTAGFPARLPSIVSLIISPVAARTPASRPLSVAFLPAPPRPLVTTAHRRCSPSLARAAPHIPAAHPRRYPILTHPSTPLFRHG